MKYKNRHSFCFKAIAIGMVCLLLVNNISWAYPDKFNLAAQSIFKPLQGKQIRDIGIIKYYVLCLAKCFPDFTAINRDIKGKITHENLDIILEFSAKNKVEFTSLLRNKKGEYIIPCKINRTQYYAYVTRVEKSGPPIITIFTKTEFKNIKENGFVAHRERLSREEKKIAHEMEYDTFLAITHSNKIGLETIPKELREEALRFFISLGVDPKGDFIREAREFMQQDDNIILFPSVNTLNIKIGEKNYSIPIEMDIFHVSNDYVNIPKNIYGDIVQVLVHALAAKSGFLWYGSGVSTKDLMDLYILWKASGKKVNLSKKISAIEGGITEIKIKDLKRMQERDYGGKDGYQQEYIVIPKVVLVSAKLLIAGLVLMMFNNDPFTVSSPPLSYPLSICIGMAMLFFTLIIHERSHFLAVRWSMAKDCIEHIGLFKSTFILPKDLTPKELLIKKLYFISENIDDFRHLKDIYIWSYR